jgi:selenocysteine lyase/cysteine desulfurase
VAVTADDFGLAPIAPESPDWFAQMVTIPLPPCDVTALKTRLYDDYHIEVPLVTWNGSPYIRVSFQGYNDERDLEALVGALKEML